jgi:hypothetical protein
MRNKLGTWDIGFYESQPHPISPIEETSELGIKVRRLDLSPPRQVGVIFGRPATTISVQRMLLRIAWQCLRMACSPYLWGIGRPRTIPEYLVINDHFTVVRGKEAQP